jgi:hypothetical protein
MLAPDSEETAIRVPAASIDGLILYESNAYLSPISDETTQSRRPGVYETGSYSNSTAASQISVSALAVTDNASA